MVIKKYRSYYRSGIGLLEIIVTDDAVVSLEFAEEEYLDNNTDDIIYMKKTDQHPLLKACTRQLDEYLKGRRKEFTLKLQPEGTDFQKRAWEELRKIPYGETISYGEQARRLGNKNACRAVGGANGKNKISIIIPCHRVIGKDGSLTGFGAGIQKKKWLLKHEQDTHRVIYCRTTPVF